jgi:uncharacterized protein (DUF2225 family)
MNSTLPALSPQQLRRAADIKEEILFLQKQLNRILGASGNAGVRRKRRRMSAAARAKIAAAARARWARIRAGKK